MTLTSTTLKRLNEGFYESFSSKEKESYNISKLISLMSDYGYLEHMRINGDKNGADIIFYRSSDCAILKVQLKGRLTFKKSYQYKELFVAYPVHKDGEINWYIYNHDDLLSYVLKETDIRTTSSWTDKGSYSWPRAPTHILQYITELETKC